MSTKTKHDQKSTGKVLRIPDLSNVVVPIPFANDGIGHIASDIEPRELDWLWWPWWPAGQIGVLASAGGVGKGLYCADVAARITRGNRWPCSDEYAPVGNVVWCEEEDDLDSIVVPRLMAAKANLKRVKLTASEEEFNKHFNRRYIRDNHVRLIVLSPLLSFIGVSRYNDDQAVRKGLRRLKARVKGTDCAIIGIMHPNKKMDAAAIERLLGSSAFRNFVRTIVLFKPDHNEVRVMHGKHNLGPKADDLMFSRVNRRPELPKGAYWGVEWDTTEENDDPNSAFELKKQKDEPSAREWLLDYLGDRKWKACKEIFQAGEAHGYTKAAIKQAKNRLNERGERVVHKVRGFGESRRDFWRLMG